MSAKVLVIGGGGREYALAWKLKESPQVEKIYVAPGNGGTAIIAENVAIDFTDAKSLVEFAKKNEITLTVIGQEAASEAGVVDAFRSEGLPIFGPTKAAVKIESSKAFSKELMQEQSIPTAAFKVFTDATAAKDYLKNRQFPQVIKASGLAEGKGVVIAEDEQTAIQAIDDMMVKKVFKDAGDTTVIEDFLDGQEVSVHALCDGKSALLFPASQDHKQVNDGGVGPNTGGMGVVAPLPWVSDRQLEEIQARVVQPTLDGLQKHKAPFTGCLYPGLMIGKNIKVLEFNARFGDPEAETYLRLLDCDLYEILVDCVNGSLDPSTVKWKAGAAISVAAVSGGYPGAYQKGYKISGIEEAEKIDDVVVMHAGTAMNGEGLVTNGGRVLYVTAFGRDVAEARSKAYQAIKKISFEGMHYRSDIGLAAEKA